MSLLLADVGATFIALYDATGTDMLELLEKTGGNLLQDRDATWAILLKLCEVSCLLKLHDRSDLLE